MYELNDLKVLIKSKTPIIVIETHEEERVTELFTQLVLEFPRQLYQWAVTEGLRRIDVNDMPAQAFNKEPLEALKHIRSGSTSGIYLFMDFHPYIEDPFNIRTIKEIALQYEEKPNTLVFISHNLKVPAELEKFVAHFELRLPNTKELQNIVIQEAIRWQGKNNSKHVIQDDEVVEHLARNLTGLPEQDVRRLARQAIAEDGALTTCDLPEIMAAKYRLLSRDNGLSFEYNTAKFSDVAGMKKLKSWLNHRKQVFIAENPPKGLDRPKGVLLIGVQGSGKSLTAKAIAGVWGLPLLRLDMGSLFNKFIGETEKNLRDAIKTAEVMSPCVLWIDEIEKGISGGDDTTGTSDRVLGTILTWMAERKQPVFLAITANNIEALPPELIRKGRLDEIFFVDLPDEETRQEIFRIHLAKRDVSPDSFDLNRLAKISKGFSGAEIEQAIVSALYAAHAENTPLKQIQVLEELLSTKPLSVVMAEKVEKLRQWASSRTVSAN
ncbi:MAG: AAA family ATPase [Pseudomonadota bacterium]